MASPTIALSLRVPGDVHEALAAYADCEGISVSEAALQAIYALVADKPTTVPAARSRIAAEGELTAKVMSYAVDVKQTEYDTEVTRTMFRWIAERHRAVYDRAIGVGGEHAIRINPQLARRFAYAINAKPVLNAKRNPAKGYLPRNANELIQSFTLLEKSKG